MILRMIIEVLADELGETEAEYGCVVIILGAIAAIVLSVALSCIGGDCLAIIKEW